MRDLDFVPTDVIIDDISSDGCRLSAVHGLAPRDRISIGLPGFGMMTADVIWAGDGSAGIRFNAPLGPYDIAGIRAADTVIAAPFPACAAPRTESARVEGWSLSKRARSLVISAAALAAWALGAGGAWLGIRLAGFF
ncbi:hypothetical protein F4U94_16990 [Sphingobium limneticum]|uniref:hypothetical protein n=1 Tax=Sphingobium limneticum TaxID=1007511 RepID=UPI00123D79DA|nr:hypothetical protein [Sphingobium limneticum]KAA9013002.1 hypothetical protein F4U94_16990 [Sphingobium limneticum]